MRRMAGHALRIVLVVVLGGFAGAALARYAPGWGVDDEDLNSSLSAASHAALHASDANGSNPAAFYVDYWGRLLRGDLGTSVALHAPVSQLLKERVPETCKSVGAGLALAWTMGLGLALLSLLPVARFAAWGAWLLASLVLCLPAAVLALLCVYAHASGRLAIGLIVFPKVYQFTRNLLARSAALPHVLTARAKGAGECRILLRHVLPVAAPQILALGGVSVCMALAACVPVEALCDLPGIGQLAWRAALSRDLTLLVNLTMIMTVVTLAANSGMDLLGGLIGEGRG